MTDTLKPIPTRVNVNARRAAAMDTTTPIPGPPAGAGAPTFETEQLPDPPTPVVEPPQTRKPVITMQISAVYQGYQVQISFDGQMTQLPGAIERLKALGATPTTMAPAAPIAAADDLPDGWKLCKKHGAPMRPRNKQNEHWHSHNVGTADNPCWCKGYPGADSPGYGIE